MREARLAFEEMSGVDSLNYLTETPRQYSPYVIFLTQPDIRQGIHVGATTPFVNVITDYTDGFLIESLETAKPDLERLLLNGHYKILIYHGQLDALTPYPSAEQGVQGLMWKNKKLYK